MMTALCGALCATGVQASTDVGEDPYADAYERGDAIAEAYQQGDATTYRHVSTELMLSMDVATTDQLELQVQALVELTANRSAEGLEAVLVAGVEELDDRGYDGYGRALVQLEALAAAYWNSPELLRPNARVPLRLGGPLVRHVPLQLVRDTLETQLLLGDAEFERALGMDQCSQAAIAAYGLRFGADQADLLQQLCDRLGGATGAGIGAAGMLSEVDCFGTDEPSRTDRLHQLMMDCLESMTEGESSPFASGGNAMRGDIITNLQGLKSHSEGSDTTVYTRNGQERVRVQQLAGGETLTTYTDDNGAKIKTETRTASGTLVTESWDDGDVKIDVLHDGDVTFETYTDKATGETLVITRDADGNVIDQVEYDANGQPKASGGDPVADTAECFEFELSLAHEQARARLESDGVSPGPETINPGLEQADPEPMPGSDCFGEEFGSSLDDSFGCIDQVVICDMGSLPDADCNCQPSTGVVNRNVQCEMMMLCGDGAQPQWVDGRCECTGGEPDFTSPDLLGPSPDPVADGGIFENFGW